MDWNTLQDARVSLLTKLVMNASGGFFGRTALMKFCYLLQAVRGVPLGYRFTLYSYGPFDSHVLSDLGTAEALEAVKSTINYYNGGYGYRISPAEHASEAIADSEDWLLTYADDIDWVLAEFGSHSSADLELESTIVFVDRESARTNEQMDISTLAQKVKSVKPHFGESFIAKKATELYELDVLIATIPAVAIA